MLLELDILMTGFELGRGGSSSVDHVLMTGLEPGRGVLRMFRVRENNCNKLNRGSSTLFINNIVITIILKNEYF